MRARLRAVAQNRAPAHFDFARVAEHRIRLLGNAVSLEEQTPVTAAHRAAFGHLVEGRCHRHLSLEPEKRDNIIEADII